MLLTRVCLPKNALIVAFIAINAIRAN